MSRFVWPGINSEVRKWAHSCIQCQRSKVHQHSIIPLGTFATPDAYFDHVHIDIVGPLPLSNGCVYLLTCIDRFTRWPEAVPIADSTAVTVAHAFVHTWVSRFGVPSTVTSKRGRQFESNLWMSFSQLLGVKHTRTTAYHPIANGPVEHFNRCLKSSLKSSSCPDRWVDMLPLALLGIRITLKEDLRCTSAELVYGATLRLPGEFLISHDSTDLDPASYVSQLKQSMLVIRCTPTQHPQHSFNKSYQQLSTYCNTCVCLPRCSKETVAAAI